MPPMMPPMMAPMNMGPVQHQNQDTSDKNKQQSSGQFFNLPNNEVYNHTMI